MKLQKQTQTILVVMGTRPEAIKLAPVIQALGLHADCARTVICSTAQHRQMLDQVLQVFEIRPDYDLDIMRERQSLTTLAASVLVAIEKVIAEVRPDWVMVQGDTTTAMAASLAAFYAGVKVIHVEAGLRTYDRQAPFPEEVNRRLTAVVADLHCAPTEQAYAALRAEGVGEEAIVLTGNTVIDALLWMRERVRCQPPDLPATLVAALKGKRLILVTGHRRESFGEPFERICLALRELAHRRSDICIVYPVHLNPNVREPVYRLLRDAQHIHLLEPLAYPQFVWLMDQAYLVLTDSGGVQEEAPSLKKPVLVMRDTTERPEGVAAGVAILVGTDHHQIVSEVVRLIDDADAYEVMTRSRNPYGDGMAAARIVAKLLR